jgi:hypothetical protein
MRPGALFDNPAWMCASFISPEKTAAPAKLAAVL